MRILYVTTIGGTMSFFEKLIKVLLDSGHSVDIACNTETSAVPHRFKEWGCKVFSLPCSRNPLDRNNLKSIKLIRKLAITGRYDVIHCHTPIAAACTRVACRSLRNSGLKVVYTAHGFHFFSGAPIANWALYYPVERMCSHWTDVLITINREDYAIAKSKMKAKSVIYVPGVGIDTTKYRPNILSESERNELRSRLGVGLEDLLVLSVGELNANKNHKSVIYALSQMNRADWRYVIAGEGGLRADLVELADNLGVSDRVQLLGWRSDVAQLYCAADLFVHPSFREGLPVALMEAMASGTPCIASDIRGCKDLLDPSCLFAPDDVGSICQLIADGNANAQVPSNLEKVGSLNAEHINDIMLELYNSLKRTERRI